MLNMPDLCNDHTDHNGIDEEQWQVLRKYEEICLNIICIIIASEVEPCSYRRDRKHAGYHHCEYLKSVVGPRSEWSECFSGGGRPAPASYYRPSLLQSSSHCSVDKLDKKAERRKGVRIFTCISWPSKPLTLGDVAQTSSCAIVAVNSELDVSDHHDLVEGYKLDCLGAPTVHPLQIVGFCRCIGPVLTLIISYIDWEILGSSVVFMRIMKVFDVKTIYFLDATEINHQRGILPDLWIRRKPRVLLGQGFKTVINMELGWTREGVRCFIGTFHLKILSLWISVRSLNIVFIISSPLLALLLVLWWSTDFRQSRER